MARTTKDQTDKPAVRKGAGIFDFINGMSRDKKSWDSFSETDQKAFSPWLVNRWLSMIPEFTETVNVFQQFTIGILKPREVYMLYSGVLPQQSLYLKYIKGKKDEKYSKDLIEFMKLYYSISKKEVIEYLEILLNTPEGIEEVINILQKYGNDDKKIKKMLKSCD